MARRRGRAKIRYIMDRAERKNTLRKRLPNLVKKTRELAVLCDVPTCLVVYRPGEKQPVVWPSPEAAKDVVREYLEVRDVPRFNHQQDGADFTGKLVEKKKKELSAVEREIHDKEINLALFDSLAGHRTSFDDLSLEAFARLGFRVEGRHRTVLARLEEIRDDGAVLPPLPTQLIVQPPPSPLLQEDVEFPPPLDADDGSGIPTIEELEAFFMSAGISFDDDTA